MKSKIMNPHKISADSDNKQKSYGMLLIELVTWGVTNRDVLLLATIRYMKISYMYAMWNSAEKGQILNAKPGGTTLESNTRITPQDL